MLRVDEVNIQKALTTIWTTIAQVIFALKRLLSVFIYCFVWLDNNVCCAISPGLVRLSPIWSLFTSFWCGTLELLCTWLPRLQTGSCFSKAAWTQRYVHQHFISQIFWKKKVIRELPETTRQQIKLLHSGICFRHSMVTEDWRWSFLSFTELKMCRQCSFWGAPSSEHDRSFSITSWGIRFIRLDPVFSITYTNDIPHRSKERVVLCITAIKPRPGNTSVHISRH